MFCSRRTLLHAIRLAPPLYRILPPRPPISPHIQTRTYAKKKGKPTTKEPILTPTPDIAFNIEKYASDMHRGVTRFREDVGSIRLGRAVPSLLDSVVVAHKSSRVALSAIAQVNVKDANTLMVIVNDEELVPIVDKAIRNADLGLNPQKHDATVLRIPIPKLTQAYKDTLLKQAAQLAEKTRNHVRTVRADARAELKKLKSVPSDTVRGLEKQIQVVTDKCMGQVDEALSAKQKEIERA
ncbi:ribosome recycling factor [Spizellomyces punctatus DAOM BR117]|uniref:Ribosome recycling factor n=1 Tax=Spizellomyces punctatus (strain DAOM BR117) TaxID=645134 RepID=A0A0L0H9F8_SPIPD|nr:ribosome recycling factor [Spizellomyces punctatus DAOM BR117]KNC98175.1 ribosome recycling factor [Spizellomyces punctatus DAOM BR117]|eukprot:XP_016606215.1 ribosome recycling factor [Spizellomyces punctatus DAOM BR117]